MLWWIISWQGDFHFFLWVSGDWQEGEWIAARGSVKQERNFWQTQIKLPGWLWLIIWLKMTINKTWKLDARHKVTLRRLWIIYGDAAGIKSPSVFPSCQSRACRTRSGGDTGRYWVEMDSWSSPWRCPPPSEWPSVCTGISPRHLWGTGRFTLIFTHVRPEWFLWDEYLQCSEEITSCCCLWDTEDSNCAVTLGQKP